LAVDLGLEGRVVIITGGASNIGRGLALGFARERARVYIGDLDDEQALKVCAKFPDRIEAEHLDVTDRESAEAAVQRVLQREGRIDVLVNNAGWTVDKLFMEQSRGDWEKILAIELWGFLNCTRAVLDSMVERRYGRVITIGSDAGRIGEWREVVHSGAKAAVMAMSKALSRELGKHGITFNVVSPGFTPGKPETSGRGSQWAGEQGAQFSPELLEKIAKSYPIRRLGTPEDLVPVVLLLASEHASYITGQTWSVSGGYTMV
jgi:2-hydroxycyclohexanecarboxyl-CoA dehydrogenase